MGGGHQQIDARLRGLAPLLQRLDELAGPEMSVERVVHAVPRLTKRLLVDVNPPKSDFEVEAGRIGGELERDVFRDFVHENVLSFAVLAAPWRGGRLLLRRGSQEPCRATARP